MDIVKDEFSRIGLEYTLKITNLFGVNEEHKILWNQDILTETAEKQEPLEAENSVDIFDLTVVEIKAIGYTEIEFQTQYGQIVYVPKVYEKYWNGIQNKLGIMKRLGRENDQVGFDIELRRALQDMFQSKSIQFSL
jgi:hypothetical protein